jgi:small conductance mechanosensitive channel
MSASLFAQQQWSFDALNVARLQNDLRELIGQEAPDVIRNVVLALAVFVAGRWLAALAERLLGQALRRAKVDETLTRFLQRLAYTVLICATALAAVEKLGINTASFAAVLAAAGLAISMATKDSLANFASGIMIILFRPFNVGDFIEAAGTKGIVEEIHVFNTILNSPDNVKTYVPNGAILAGNITNYSRERFRRIDMVVGCGYKDDLRAVKRFLEQAIASHPLVLKDPAPMVAVGELADNSVNLYVRPWVLNTDYWRVRWDLTEKIKLGFDEHGFEIPFPQRSIHVLNDTVPVQFSERFNSLENNRIVQPRRAA